MASKGFNPEIHDYILNDTRTIMKFHYWNYLPSKNKYINYFIQPNLGCLFEKVKKR